EADGAVLVDLRAAALNQRDLWLLRGEVPAARIPVTLGSDGAGVRRDTGDEVVLHAMLPGPSDQWPHGDEVLSPQFAMLGGEADETGGRLSRRVDVVIETVGAATWGHSLRSVAPGGRIVTAGATTGTDPSAELPRLYMRGVDVRGTSMGTLEELRGLCAFVDE